MNKFEKVSQEQFFDGYSASYDEYEAIKIPVRATVGSAGYDFYSPVDFVLKPGKSIIIRSGIRLALDDDKFLMIVPRSGLGFKYKLRLDNTVGIIDSDYYNSDNEGHIAIKLTNEGEKTLFVSRGDAIAQGIILTYGLVANDNVSNKRNGGFGSTGK